MKSWYYQVLRAISAVELCLVESSSLFGLSANTMLNYKYKYKKLTKDQFVLYELCMFNKI